MARWNTRLRKAREAMGLSLRGAVNLLYESEKIKFDRTHLWQVENGASDIPASKFRALCKIYCADANWILDLKE